MALRPPLSQTRAVAPVAEPTGGVAFASSDDGLRWSADCQPLQIRHFRDPLVGAGWMLSVLGWLYDVVYL